MKRYIDAEKLKTEIQRRIKELIKEYRRTASLYYDGGMVELDKLDTFIDSLQQEQPIKVYRVENEKEQKGLWRKFDGTWEPLFDMLTDGQCKDMPMDDNPTYREGGKRWFASAPSKETLQKWFSQRDLEELTAAGFTITEFEVLEYRKLSDFEYIFTRESIVNKTNINATDIYSKEQPEQTCTCKTCGFYENNCPFIRGKLIPYPNKVCKDYTYSAIKEQEQPDEFVGVAEPPSKTFPRVNEFICGSSYRR